MKQNPRSQELPQYVGYAEIRAATGLDKRQIQRLMTTGKFPRPEPLGTRSNRWRVEVINEWLSSRAMTQVAALSDMAVTDPEKLLPDDIPEVLSSLARRYAALTGVAIKPDDVTGFTYRLSDEQRAVVAERAAAEYTDRVDVLGDAFARLDVVRSWLVVAGLLPAIRPAADAFLKNITGLEITQTQEELRALALDILDRSLSSDAAS